jgi:hypothetical protein
MAAENPEIIDTTENEWTPVASAATLGFIYPKDGDVVYYHTYKLAGETAPDDTPVPGDDDFIGVPVYYRDERIAGETVLVGGVVMGGSAPLDHYIYTKGGAGKLIIQRGN